MRLLTVNAGSSNTKLALYQADGEASPRRVARAKAEYRDGAWWLQRDGDATAHRVACEAASPEALLDGVDGLWPLREIDAVGHRVVHGGTRYTHAVQVDDAVMHDLRALESLAPLHQPINLAWIDALAHRAPRLPQIACFDTAFHHAIAEQVWRFALPHAMADAGIRRYGFHGLSYQSIRDQLRVRDPRLAHGRVVVAHLGSGCSACAMRDGISMDTSMGYSALDGLPMSTRCGALDPGVLLDLLQQRGMSPNALQRLLYKQSGLLGMSGISGDARVLVASDAPQARMALDVFAFRTAREIAALTTALGGLDGVVFTGGVGEHQPTIRARIVEHLHAFDACIDPVRNAAGEGPIHASNSGIALWMLHTDEEAVIARSTHTVLQGAST